MAMKRRKGEGKEQLTMKIEMNETVIKNKAINLMKNINKFIFLLTLNCFLIITNSSYDYDLFFIL